MTKVQEAIKRIAETQRREKMQLARESIASQRSRAALRLIIDDIEAEGIDPDSPLGKAVFIEMVGDIWRKNLEALNPEFGPSEFEQGERHVVLGTASQFMRAAKASKTEEAPVRRLEDV